MAILVKKGEANPTPTYGKIGELGTAGIRAPITSTIVPPSSTAPSGGVAPSSPTSITQPNSTNTYQKPTISAPSGSSMTNTLMGAGAGALAGNFLKDKTGKTISDMLGLTKPAAKPVAPVSGLGGAGGNAGSTPYKDTSATTVSEDLGGGYYQDGNGNMYDESGNLMLSSNGANGYIYFGDPDNPVYFDKDYNEVPNPDGSTSVETPDVVDDSVDQYPSTIVVDGVTYDSATGAPLFYADGTEYSDTIDYNQNASEDTQYEDEYEAKEGGLITMMKNGGNVRGFYNGGGASQSELDYQNSAQTAEYRDRSQDMVDAGYSDNGDGTYSTMQQDGSIVTFNNMGTPVNNPLSKEYTPIDGNSEDGQFGSTTPIATPYQDTSGTTVSMPSFGGLGTSNTQAPAASSGLGGITDLLKNGGVQGALVGSLIAQLMGSSGSSGGQNQGVDMSKVGALTPRTTDFGIGPTNVVTADQYRNPVGTGTDIYAGTDLYHNLNAPGYNPVNPAPAMASGGSTTHYTYGKQIDPIDNMGGAPQAMKSGGLPTPVDEESGVPTIDGRNDYRMGAAVSGEGTGQSDDIPAMLADGEYVLDSDLVSMLGDGSNKAGSQILDKWREEIRGHKRSAPVDEIPPPAKSPLEYMKGIK